MIRNYTVRLIFRVVAPKIIRKKLANWRHSARAANSAEKKSFVELNTAYWSRQESTPQETGVVLVDGTLGGYGPNYLIRTGIIARAIAESLKVLPVVVLNDYLELEQDKIELYQSYGIQHFESTLNYYPSVLQRIRNILKAIRLYSRCHKPEDLLKLETSGILFGDLMYDTILKNTAGLLTINRVTERELYYIYEALNLVSMSEKLIGGSPIKWYVSTHSQYLSYGIFLRLCLLNNIKAIETTDIQLWLHCRKDSVSPISYPKYHDYLRCHIRSIIDDRSSEISLAEIDRLLDERFAGKYDQSDVKLAYKGKRIYARGELCDALEISNEGPIAFIFAHVFADAPQGLCDGMLFRDYYTWLGETIAEASKITEVNWVVKPHPANALYNETGFVEKIVKDRNVANIFICPNDLSPASVVKTAAAVVTAQGTVGIEYSCFGIPAILASRPFYSGFGFTVEPGSIHEYKQALRRVANIGKLSEEQIDCAKKVFGSFMKMQQTDTTLIDTEVLMSVWGGTDESSEKAFRIINKRLNGLDQKGYSLYRETVELVTNAGN